MKAAISIFIIFLFYSQLSASIFESVVKVHSGNSRGTGTCINEDSENIYVMTNRHVVGNNKTVELQFYNNGHQSVKIPAKVIWIAYRSNEPIDIALLKVQKNQLNFTPNIVKFQFDDKVYNIGDTCLTIGCPQAAWPRAYKGHIVNIEDGCYLITPDVEPGQSGSVLFNADGSKAIGLIAWTTGKYGRAMTIEPIKKAVVGQHTNFYFKQPWDLSSYERSPFPQNILLRQVQCGPDGCFPNFPREPRNPREPDEFGPETNPTLPDSDGIKIFPTYPGEVEPIPNQPLPETPKIDDKFADLEGRISTLEEASKQNVLDHQAFDTKLNELNTNIQALGTDLNAKIVDLGSKIDNKLDNQEVITPGKLDEFLKNSTTITDISKTQESLKTNQINMQETQNTLQNSQKTFVETETIDALAQSLKDEIKTQSSRIDDAITNNNKDNLSTLSTILNKTLEVREAATTTTYNDFGQTALSTGIPSFVVLVIGWWFKRVVEKYFGITVPGQVGGKAIPNPFPTPIVPGQVHQ